MNCFPCKGPACNFCKKFDRIKAAVNAAVVVRCPSCGGKVDLSRGICVACGRRVIQEPGRPSAHDGGGHSDGSGRGGGHDDGTCGDGL